MNENVFVSILQDINNHPIRFGECTVTFTYHDGKIQFYTVTTSERKNVKDVKPALVKEQAYKNGKSA